MPGPGDSYASDETEPLNRSVEAWELPPDGAYIRTSVLRNHNRLRAGTGFTEKLALSFFKSVGKRAMKFGSARAQSRRSAFFASAPNSIRDLTGSAIGDRPPRSGHASRAQTSSR